MTPPAPSNLAISASDIHGKRATLEVQWDDNCEDQYEYVTIFEITEEKNGLPVTTQSVYASDYDQPPGSTGRRTGEIVSSSGGPFLARARTILWHSDFNNGISIKSDWSESISFTAKKGHGPK